MMFHSQANTTHFHKKYYALGLILKVRIFENRKWLILLQKKFQHLTYGSRWNKHDNFFSDVFVAVAVVVA